MPPSIRTQELTGIVASAPFAPITVDPRYTVTIQFFGTGEATVYGSISEALPADVNDMIAIDSAVSPGEIIIPAGQNHVWVDVTTGTLNIYVQYRPTVPLPVRAPIVRVDPNPAQPAGGGVDVVAPNAPTGLAVVGTPNFRGAILQCDPVSDAVNYLWYANSVLVAATPFPQFNMWGLPADATTAVTVASRDAAGNISVSSAPINVTTPEGPAIDVGGGGTLSITLPSGTIQIADGDQLIAAVGASGGQTPYTFTVSGDDTVEVTGTTVQFREPARFYRAEPVTADITVTVTDNLGASVSGNIPIEITYNRVAAAQIADTPPSREHAKLFLAWAANRHTPAEVDALMSGGITAWITNQFNQTAVAGVEEHFSSTGNSVLSYIGWCQVANTGILRHRMGHILNRNIPINLQAQSTNQFAQACYITMMEDAA